MTPRLRLLDRVAWDGTEIPGDRPAALLAGLASHPHGLADATLTAQVWGEEQPDRPTKALQVLVSRLRSLDRSLVVRREGGYRLGVGRGDVNATMDSDLRFFNVLFIVYGLAFVWAARDLRGRAAAVDLLGLIFFVGGLVRFLAWAASGTPSWFYVAMIPVELVVPVVNYVWLRAFVAGGSPRSAELGDRDRTAV